LLERARVAGLGPERAADAREARIPRHGEIEGERGERGDLVEDQGHEPARRAGLVVAHGQFARAEDQLAQERGHRQHADAGGQVGRGVVAHVQRAHRDRARHADLVGHAARHPYRALGRHRPGALARAHEHGALGGEDELGPLVRVRRDVEAVGKVLGHGGHRTGDALIVLWVGGASTGWAGHGLHVRFATIVGRL